MYVYIYSKYLLVYYYECCNLFGYATLYLFVISNNLLVYYCKLFRKIVKMHRLALYTDRGYAVLRILLGLKIIHSLCFV